MTADQRLNQLEPIISEAITVLDRHTAQLKGLQSVAALHTEILTKQSDNISFLLDKSIQTDARLARLESDVAELKGGVAELTLNQIESNKKLDLILSKLG